MSLIDRPLHVLIAAPALELPALDRAPVEALMSAIERQGQAALFEWLWPATAQQLAARLAADDLPTVDCLAWDGDAKALAENRVDWLGDAQPALVLAWSETLAPLAESLGGVGTLLLDRRLEPGAQRVALEAWLTALLAGESPSAAVAQALASLNPAALRTRLSAGGETIDPPSWLLWQSGKAFSDSEPLLSPAPSANSGVERVVTFPSPSLAPDWLNLALEPLPGGLPAQPQHGFFGRGAETRMLETALREGQGPVWLYGHLGVGKTTLALHTARWLVRTGAIRRVVYSSWGGGGMAEAAVYALGRALLGTRWDPRDSGALRQVMQALASTPTLVIWDQIETLLPEGTLPLDAEGRQALWELADQLQATGARLLVIADTPELPAEVNRLSKAPALAARIAPLAQAAALDFWDALHQGHEPDAEAAQALVQGLGGHPLSIALTAEAYPQQSAARVLEQITAMMPGLATGEARLGNQALDLGIECLMRALGDDTREMLVRLGLYTQGFMQALALRLMEIDAEVWQPIHSRLVSAQLVTALRMPGFNVPFVRLHPALERFLGQRMAGTARVQWQPIYTAGYLGLVGWLLQSESRSPEHVQFLAQCELGNLRKTLRLLLAEQQLNQAADLLRSLTHYYEMLGYVSELRQFKQQFERTAQAVVPQEGPLSRAGVQFMLQRCDELLAQRQVPQAGALLQQLSTRINAENGLSYSGDLVALDKARVLHRLGRAVLAMGKFEAALASMQQALAQLPTPSNDQQVLATRLEILQELAKLLRAGGAHEPAMQFCQQGLELATRLNDDLALGNLHSEQGILLTIQSDLAAARRSWEAAMFHYQRLGDQSRIAQVWEGLSQVAWQEHDLERAQTCLDRALEALPPDHAPTHEGHIYTLMAQIAEMDGRVRDAERHYGAAIRIYQDHQVVPEMVNIEMALARLLLAHGRHQEARIQAEAARASAEKLGPQAVPWEIFELLRDVAVAEDDQVAANRWRKRAQAVFGASPAADNVRQQWHGLIGSVSSSCRGEAMDMAVVEVVEKLESTPQWQQLAQAVWRVLEGERDLEAFNDLDPVDAVVVRAILDAIEHPLSDDESPHDSDAANEA